MIPGEKEISLLDNYFSNQEQLSLGLKWIKNGRHWEQNLITLNKREVDCLSLFLSVFHIGHLKQTTFSSKDVNAFISQYRWIETKAANPFFYEKICFFAHQQIKKGDLSIFYSVSIATRNPYNHFWNPHLKVQDLVALEKRKNGESIDFHIRLEGKDLALDYPVSETEMQSIQVGFSPFLFSTSSRDHDSDKISQVVVHHTFIAPSPPYFSF